MSGTCPRQRSRARCSREDWVVISCHRSACLPLHGAAQSTVRPVPRARGLESGLFAGFANDCMRLGIPITLESDSGLESTGRTKAPDVPPVPGLLLVQGATRPQTSTRAHAPWPACRHMSPPPGREGEVASRAVGGMKSHPIAADELVVARKTANAHATPCNVSRLPTNPPAPSDLLPMPPAAMQPLAAPVPAGARGGAHARLTSHDGVAMGGQIAPGPVTANFSDRLADGRRSAARRATAAGDRPQVVDMHRGIVALGAS
jgi:hypothetical protein